MATIPPLTPALEACPATSEFDQTESPFRDAVVETAFRLGPDGSITIPQTPGLGVLVIPEAVEQFRTQVIRIT